MNQVVGQPGEGVAPAGAAHPGGDQAAAQQAVFGIQNALKLVKGEKVDAKDGVIETPVELVIKQ